MMIQVELITLIVKLNLKLQCIEQVYVISDQVYAVSHAYILVSRTITITEAGSNDATKGLRERNKVK